MRTTRLVTLSALILLTASAAYANESGHAPGCYPGGPCDRGGGGPSYGSNYGKAPFDGRKKGGGGGPAGFDQSQYAPCGTCGNGGRAAFPIGRGGHEGGLRHERDRGSSPVRGGMLTSGGLTGLGARGGYAD